MLSYGGGHTMKKVLCLVFIILLGTIGFSQQFTRELKLEDKRMNGQDVKLVQEKLLSFGFSEVGEADGWFGPKTEESVKKCQLCFGFTPDGVVRKDFFTALYKTDKLTLELIDVIKRANAVEEELKERSIISFEYIEPNSHGLPCDWYIYYKTNTVEKVSMKEAYEFSFGSIELYPFSNGDKFFMSYWLSQDVYGQNRQYFITNYLITKNKTYSIKNGQLITDKNNKELEQCINRFENVHLDYLLK